MCVNPRTCFLYTRWQGTCELEGIVKSIFCDASNDSYSYRQPTCTNVQFNKFMSILSSQNRTLVKILSESFTLFYILCFSVRLLSILRGHSVFSSQPQRPCGLLALFIHQLLIKHSPPCLLNLLHVTATIDTLHAVLYHSYIMFY